MTDHLAICPICNRVVGVLSRRVAVELAHSFRWREIEGMGDQYYAQKCEPTWHEEKILSRWRSIGLVVEVLVGESPATETLGHASKCKFDCAAKRKAKVA